MKWTYRPTIGVVDDQRTDSVRNVGYGSYQVCKLVTGDWPEKEVQQHGRLIELAPEMLEELEFLLGHCLERYENCNGEQVEQIVAGKSVIERVRQIVAKARGEA
jgi:hypothetical protein